ncbi:MAG: ABC transporter permease [Planctomycetes bacterium]|nr:ABC transporter permease [Planctomycetota bacterium]
MAATFQLRAETAPNGRRRVVLTGQVMLGEGRRLWRELPAAFGDARLAELELGEVSRLDGGSAALLAALLAQLRATGCEVEVVGASGEAARMLRLYDCARSVPCERPSPQHPGLITEAGNVVVAAIAGARAILEFVGDFAVGIAQAIRRPASVHLGQFGSLIERAGADGVPIVLLINFLVGGILGLQGAIQLHRFGADQFLADMVGLAMVRELGPLMTAILVTGRSGAAYAAELGTMKVNEEIDALRTLGQDPQRFLVFPRVVALVLVVPLLTLLGNLIGAVGGWAIAVSYLDQPTVVYLQALQAAIDLGDIGTGLLKSVGFATAIGLVACQRGLATTGGADGVGRATTSAVVTSLFLLVVLDALFTWAFTLLDW